MANSVEISAQAQSYYGLVQIPKADAVDALAAEWERVKHLMQVPVNRRGFRPHQSSQQEAEKMVGIGDLYRTFWHDQFLAAINASQGGRTFVIYSDEINFADRGAYYELGAVIFFCPAQTFDEKFLDNLKKGGEAFVRDTFTGGSALKLNLDRVIAQHIEKFPAPADSAIAEGDAIRVESQSDVHKSFDGPPQQVLWQLTPERLPADVIGHFVGKQVGQEVIFPMTMPQGVSMRMHVKILGHFRIDSTSLDAVAVVEGLQDTQALENRERRNLESLFERQKSQLFFSMVLKHVKVHPLPGGLVYDAASAMCDVLREELGDREFVKRYGRDINATIERHLPGQRQWFLERVVSYGLMTHFQSLPTRDELVEAVRQSGEEVTEEAVWSTMLDLCRDRALHMFCGVEPPHRGLIKTPSSANLLLQ